MPVIRVETNHPIEPVAADALCAALSRAAAQIIGKPEQYVQTAVAPAAVAMRFGGRPGPTAFVQVYSIGGLTPAANTELSGRICALLAERGIPGDRTYISFQDARGENWGFDGGTFG